MAHNVPARERSKRQPQKKVYKDFVCDNDNTTDFSKSPSNPKNNQKKPKKNDKFPCQGCEIVFSNKEAQLLHQTKCLTVKVDMTKQGSFFGTHFSKTKDKTPQTEAKDLPPSQPLEKSFAAVVSPPSSSPTGNGHPTPATVKEIPATADKQQDPVVFTSQQKAPEENETEIGIEIVESVTQISFMDPTIQADLPPYEKVTAHPNKDYNNVDKNRKFRSI